MKNCILLFSFFLLFSSCQNNNQQLAVTEIINQTKAEFVKDGRTKLFKIAAEQTDGKITLTGETNLPDAQKKLIENLEKAKISCIDKTETLPSTKLGDQIYGVVNLSVCNIRSKPKHSAELATQALLGTQLRVLKEENDWFLIQTPDDYLGWLDKGGFTLMTKDELDGWREAEKVIIQAEFAKIYAEPSVTISDESAVISDLGFGNILIDKGLAEENNQMIKVELPDTRQGYIIRRTQTDYENWLNSDRLTGEKLVQVAQRFIGNPYLWGGTSAKGFDCSGFTKTVYLWNGIQLERDASLQVHNGIKIETTPGNWENLEAGDLLFFGRKKTAEQKEKITHVAIWMGNGKIIHATERVKIESLLSDDPDFAEERLETFIRAKRILNSVGENGIVDLKRSEWY